MRGSPRRRSGCSPTPPSPSSRKRTARCRARELVILGLGRLGGGALTHASDLDLIYLFSGSHEAESDGPKPLRATDYFNRLAPRVSAALSACRPRPGRSTTSTPGCGRPGPTGCSPSRSTASPTISASKAWTFEHMALTRARPVYGSDEDRAALAAIVDEMLRIERDPAERRRRRGRGCGSRSPATSSPSGPFDIKLGPGGLVDLEFAVHTLQLSHRIGLVAAARRRRSTALVEAGLVPPEIAGAPPADPDAGHPAAGLARFGRAAAGLARPRSRAPAGRTVGRNCLRRTKTARQSISALWRNGDEGAR